VNVKLIAEGVGLLFGLLFAGWVIAIFSAAPEQKAVVACKPVHYTLNGIGYVKAAVTGKEGEERATSAPWQDSVRLWCLKAVDRGIDASQK